jgi:hypothetical protein
LRQNRRGPRPIAAREPNRNVGVPIDTSPPPTRQRRRRLPLPVIAAAAGGVASVLVAAILSFYAADTTDPSAVRGPQPTGRTSTAQRPGQSSGGTIRQDPSTSTRQAIAAPDRQSREETIPDDGRSMWASPTGGPPLSLRYLPIGTQIFIALRPAELAGHPDGEKVLASLGPAGAGWRQILERLSGFPFAAIDLLVIGLRVDPSKQIEPSLVLRLHEPIDLPELVSQRAQAVTATHAGATYITSNQWSFYLPADEAGGAVVIARAGVMAEIIDAAGPPPLRRAMEQLLATTDASRTLTLLAAPNYLLTDAAPLLAGPATRLLKPLDWLLSDRIEAVSLSVHLGRNLFLELRASGPVDRSPADLAQRLDGRLEQVPGQVESYLVGLNPHPYGRRLLGRFPHMLQLLANYTRTGTEEGQALLRCYLPASAAHNLLMGLDLALCEGASATTTTVLPPARRVSLEDRLARKTTLQFDRDTLQHAAELLSSDTGVPITILGGDLQLEGITQNQSFGIDVQDQPAEEILARILLLANPDKTVKELADPHQTLVYVIRPGSPGQMGTVVVTTRAQAAARGEKLPKAFEK